MRWCEICPKLNMQVCQNSDWRKPELTSCQWWEEPFFWIEGYSSVILWHSKKKWINSLAWSKPKLKRGKDMFQNFIPPNAAHFCPAAWASGGNGDNNTKICERKKWLDTVFCMFLFSFRACLVRKKGLK